MLELVPRLVIFGLIVSAPGWRGLAWRTALGIGLVGAAFGWVTEGRFSVVVPGGDADIGAGIVLYYGLMWLTAGLAARSLSLLARRAGHGRPRSLWIEAACFFAVPVAYDRLMIGA